MAGERGLPNAGPIAPHGGRLVNRVLAGETRAEALARAAERPEVAAVLAEWARNS